MWTRRRICGRPSDRCHRRHRDEPRQRHRGRRGRQWEYSAACHRACHQRSPDRRGSRADHGAADALPALVWAGAGLRLDRRPGHGDRPCGAAVVACILQRSGRVGLDGLLKSIGMAPQFANGGHGGEIILGILGIVVVLVAGSIWRKRKLQGAEHSAERHNATHSISSSSAGTSPRLRGPGSREARTNCAQGNQGCGEGDGQLETRRRVLICWAKKARDLSGNSWQIMPARVQRRIADRVLHKSRVFCDSRSLSRNDLVSGKLCKLCRRDDTHQLQAAANCSPSPRVHWAAASFSVTTMKDVGNASFPPEVISVMEAALDAAVASLPEPVSSAHVQLISEAILRAAHSGERDPIVLQRLALLELQIIPALAI